MSRRLMITIVSALVVTSLSFGCSDDDPSTNNGTTNNGNTNNGTTPTNNGTTPTNNGTTPTNNGTTPTNNGTTPTNNGTTPTNNGTTQTCADTGMTECFQNSDCEATEACQDVGTSGLEVACCVTGDRGTGVLGETCVDENDCETGLCIDKNGEGYVCSQVCDQTVTCPNGYTCEIIGFCYPDGN